MNNYEALGIKLKPITDLEIAFLKNGERVYIDRGLGKASQSFYGSGKRNIKSGAQFDRYFDLDQVQGEEIELVPNGTVYDTLKQMVKIVGETQYQTKKIAQLLKGKTVADTCAKIYHFLYNHVQYKKDNPLREQLRTPLRSWRDRKNGVDCDCYCIFISSILSNAHPGVDHYFRMAAYQGDFQHVYVFVPSQSIVIDPVIAHFNYEQPYSKKYDCKIYTDRGLGQASQSFYSGASTITNVANTASSLIPVKGDPAYQSTFSKFNEKQAQILATAAGVVQVIPGIGQAVGVVLGVVSAVSSLVSKIFFTSKAKQMAAERGQYEIAIGEVRDQNMELDIQINKLRSAANELKKALGIAVSGEVSGLGLCLINCKKKEEEKKLNQTKATFDELQKQQQQKIALLDSMFDQVLQLLSIKESKNTGLYIAGGILAIAGLYVVVKRLNKRNQSAQKLKSE